MSMHTIAVQQRSPLIALLGQPNCGKSALFNRLTGASQKVANYAGVTVERKEGTLLLPSHTLRVLDLPGTYSFYPRSPDEKVTCDVLLGQKEGEARPNLIVCVADATKLRRSLYLLLSAKRLGLPCVLALNMMDVLEKQGLHIDTAKLSALLDMPVVATVATQSGGADALLATLDQKALLQNKSVLPPALSERDMETEDAQKVELILASLGFTKAQPQSLEERVDRFVLHPVTGTAFLLLILFALFQSVFALAEFPMALIEAATSAAADWVSRTLPASWFQSLVVDGLIAGVGGVLVFLPQILILFFFILVLEESGYLPRAAFLLDRLMGSLGLSGRAFIPLLSSFACAIPGVMATRSIAHPKDRLVTILLAPLMTCSARLPVYALLIGAFVPDQMLWGFSLKAWVLFALYLSGIFFAALIAWVIKALSTGKTVRPLMMELPRYHLPRARNIGLGLLLRAKIFLRRVGSVILVLTLALWFFSSFPKLPEGSGERAAYGSQIEYSLVGRLGKFIAPVFEPIGFPWQVSVSLMPSMAAREVMISSLATVYALSASEEPQTTENEDENAALSQAIAKTWSLPTALSLLAWFIFAPHCLATLSTIRRETGKTSIAIMTTVYLFLLAYGAAFVTFRLSTFLGWA